jgi:hypothetical protein
LLAAIAAAKAGGARDALLVVDEPAAFLGLTTLPGKIAHVSPAGLGSELLHKAIEPRKHFDLCVLQLGADDLPRLGELLETLAPYMRAGGKIVGFYVNSGRPVGALTLNAQTSRVAFTGSAGSMRAIKIYSAAFNRLYRKRPLSVVRGLLTLVLSMPLVFWVNRAEAAAARKGRLTDPAFRTSLTVIVQQD